MRKESSQLNHVNSTSHSPILTDFHVGFICSWWGVGEDGDQPALSCSHFINVLYVVTEPLLSDSHLIKAVASLPRGLASNRGLDVDRT